MRLPFVCKPVYNVPVKPVKSKDDCKPVCNVPSKPVRSQDVCKPVYNVPYNSGNSNVCRPFSDDASKHVKSKVLYEPISKVSFKHSKSVVSKSANHNSESGDPVCAVELLNTAPSNSVNFVVAPERVDNVSSKSGKAQAVCKSVTNLIG